MKQSASTAIEFGIHARPAHWFVQLARRFESHVEIERDGLLIDGKSIMQVMMLSAGPKTTLTIYTSGVDAEEALKVLHSILSAPDEDSAYRIYKDITGKAY